MVCHGQAAISAPECFVCVDQPSVQLRGAHPDQVASSK